jgi:hypothetical protein
MTLLMPVRVPHPYIEIRDVQRRRLITVIEFLSPANKVAPGRRSINESASAYWAARST